MLCSCELVETLCAASFHSFSKGHCVLARLFNLFIHDRVCAAMSAILRMNCNVVYALVMLISLLESGCIVAPVFRSRLKDLISGGRDYAIVTHCAHQCRPI